MRENVILNADAAWTREGVEKLRQLWAEGAPKPVIAAALGRTEALVRDKAVELKLGPAARLS